MTKTFKKFTHCGNNYYVGVSTPITPECEDCGQTIEEEPVVEEFDDNIFKDTNPVETFESVEKWRARILDD